MPPSRRQPDEPPLGPFLKWAGGKRALLDRLVPRVPECIATYYEPFLGGGALFFELARLGRFERAVLADRNEDLVECYRAIRDDHQAVIAALDRHRCDEESYYRVRALDPATLSPTERAARTIYLNKTGYNGLYRVNSKGLFNVPFGRYPATLRLYNPERMQEVARVLKMAELVVDDFETVVKGAKPGDFVYFDPPYVPLSATSSFTRYAQLPFGLPEQERLAELVRALGRRQVPALLSNSDCATTRQLYRGLRPAKVAVRRTINSVGGGRGPVSELLVKSFPYSC